MAGLVALIWKFLEFWHTAEFGAEKTRELAEGKQVNWWAWHTMSQFVAHAGLGELIGVVALLLGLFAFFGFRSTEETASEERHAAVTSMSGTTHAKLVISYDHARAPYWRQSAERMKASIGVRSTDGKIYDASVTLVHCLPSDGDGGDAPALRCLPLPLCGQRDLASRARRRRLLGQRCQGKPYRTNWTIGERETVFCLATCDFQQVGKPSIALSLAYPDYVSVPMGDPPKVYQIMVRAAAAGVPPCNQWFRMGGQSILHVRAIPAPNLARMDHAALDEGQRLLLALRDSLLAALYDVNQRASFSSDLRALRSWYDGVMTRCDSFTQELVWSCILNLNNTDARLYYPTAYTSDPDWWNVTTNAVAFTGQRQAILQWFAVAHGLLDDKPRVNA